MAKTVNFTVKLNIDGTDHLVTVTKEAKQLASEFGVAQTKAEKLRGSLITFGQLQMTFHNLQNGLQSVTNFLNNLTEESGAFAASMKAANTMAGKDAAGFKELKGQVADLAKNIPIARDQLANGLYQVISNGVPEDNWISYLEASSRSAVGGIADVGEVVKVTSTVIKNYGLEWSAAQDIQDKIQLTAKNGVTSFEQLASALPAVTGQAAQLGVSFTEMLAVMSTLTGVTGNTSEVATQLGSVLTALTKESTKSQKMADAMGISFNAASVKAAGGLRNYLQELDKTVTAYSQKTGQLKESIYSQLFGRAEALRLVNSLTGNLAEKFDENIQALDNSAGTIDAAFSEMASTGSAKMQMLKNAWGSLIDHIQGTVGFISPALNFSTQIGMSVLAVMSLRKAFAGYNATAKLSVVTTYAQATASKVSAAASKLYASAQLFANRMQIAWTFGAKAFVIQTVAMRVALAGIIGLGIGAVIAGLVMAIKGLGGEMTTATAKARGLASASETLASAEEAGMQAAANARVEIDKDIQKLSDLIKSKGDTTTAVQQLNEKYGEWFGQCSTAQQWYDTLIKNSEAYCNQLAYEAQMRVLTEKKAALEIKQERNRQKQDELREQGKDKYQQNSAGSYMAGGYMPTKDIRETSAMRQLRMEAVETGAELVELGKNIDIVKSKMSSNAPSISSALPTGPTSSGDKNKKNKKTGKTGTDTGKTEETYAEGTLGYLDKQISELNKKRLHLSDPEDLRNMDEAIAKLERAKKFLESMAQFSKEDILLYQDFDKHSTSALGPFGKSSLSSLLPKTEAIKVPITVDLKQINKDLKDVAREMGIQQQADIAEKAKKKFDGATSSVNELGSALSSLGQAIGIPALDIAGTLAQAIVTMIRGFAEATAMAAEIGGPWGWIGFSALGLAQLTAMISSVKGMGAFADGGIVSGPTLGLVGEYAGASHNPEVIAPLDKLRSMIQTPQVALPPGSIVGKVQGNDILLVAANASRTRAKSGHRTKIAV